MKRPLATGAVLFSLGILLAAYDVHISIIFLLAFVALAAFVFKPRYAAVCPLLLAVILGFVAMNSAQLHRDAIVSEFSGRSGEMELTVTEFSKDNSAVASFMEENASHKVYLTVKSDVQLYPGDIVKGEIVLRAPIDSKISVSDFSSYLASRGVFLTASAENVRVTGRKTDGIMGKIYSLRVFMDKVGEKHFSGNSRALFNAMVFGDKRLISDELSGALQASGLNHIAVVSGMHLSVMIALLMFAVHKIFGKRRIGYIIAILGAAFITLATGAGASVVRALIMCALLQLARLLYRENDILTSLAFAALIMLAVNPFTIFNAGFVLSVLSVLGIVLYNGKLEAFAKHFMPTRAAQAASLSLSAQLAVTPALIYYFGIVTPYALLSNILVVALSSGYVIVGMVFILVSKLPLLSSLIGSIMKLIAVLIESTCLEIASFPGAVIDFSSAGTLSVLIWIFLPVLIYIYPAPVKKLCKAVSVFVLIAALVVYSGEENKINMQSLAYGGKTMTAATFSKGSSILIDCPDIYDAKMLEDPLHPFKYAVLTTDDPGKVLAQESNITTIIAPKALFDREQRESLSKEARSMNVRVIFADDSRKISAGEAVIEYLPIEGVRGRAVKIENESESVVTLQGLSAADIESVLRSGVDFHCDTLKLPALTWENYSK